ncbi:hypothetical protein RND71_032916 [Anisodus tanguticus]|uniref:Uncharacterized protein n=1 Tax=Anisodus tanguticus TaxID=243964 RepID=A0AAE1RA54_9SOLA|nr:hypothetical protein RND71_032916 [Anisodus tanguticus]
MVHTWKVYDSDLLSYLDLVEEFVSKLGYVGVQQLVVCDPSDRYYEVVDDVGIRTFLALVSDKFSVINVFAVDENELGFSVPNIVDHLETETATAEVVKVVSDCSSGENSKTEDGYFSGYDFEELRVTKGKQTKVGRKTKKRTRSLIDEDDEGVARSPTPVGLTLEEELELIAP